MCTGERPFKGHDTISILMSIATENPPPPVSLNSEVPTELSDLVMHLLAKKPEDRPESAKAVVESLQEIEGQTAETTAVPGRKTKTAQMTAAPGGKTGQVKKGGGTKQTEAARTQVGEPAKRRLPLLWLVGGGVLGLGVLAAAVILFWQTPYGAVRIESDDPNVEIVFDKNGPIIKGANKEPISLRAGEHGILIKRGDFSFEADKFLLKKGQTITLKLEWLRGKVQVVQDGKVIASHAIPPPATFTNSIGMKFAWIPPGTFMMGSPKEEKERQLNETQHKVTLTKGFYMGVYTVTQEQWQEVMGNNPSRFKGEKNLPVEEVSWEACQEFIKKLRETDQNLYRLPTEAEWEYACRAGTTTPFHFGETISTEQANYNGEYIYGTGKKGVSRGKPIPVGSFPANAFGLHDMHGNVWQWCQDWQGYYPQEHVVDPQGPDKGPRRALRGGSWFYDPGFCRSATRGWIVPGNGVEYKGFRLCFSVEENGIPAPKKDPPKKEEAVVPPNPFTNSLGMKFVWIPPGNFMMGSPKEEKEREKEWNGQKGPGETLHKVTLTKGFYMGVFTVTQEQWQEVMGNNPSNLKGEKYLPVELVSWDDCQEFIKKLREKDKKLYRLPFEAEWEYACRAGTSTPFYFGETISTDQANYNGDHIDGTGKKGVNRRKTVPVGSFPANAWGLHDMHGNVWQWCQGWLGDHPQKDVVDPQGPEKGEFRVLRGGSWNDAPWDCRSANRFRTGPSDRNGVTGFRLCFSIEEDGVQAPKKDPPKKEEAAAPPKGFKNSLGMKFVWIPPGSFMMGSPKEEIGRGAGGTDETQHKVKLSKGFYMGIHVVTQEQWQEVMGNNPSHFKGEMNLPVERVSWEDCQEFIKNLREKDKKLYRLPTEAEWEYSCRAGRTTPFFFGETIFTDQANYNGEIYGNGKKGVNRGKTTPVGSFPANSFGIYDMSGNVWQWCQDRYGEYPQKDVVDPQGPETGAYRVLRGGAWPNIPDYCRSACRISIVPDNRIYDFGLRVCFSVE